MRGEVGETIEATGSSADAVLATIARVWKQVAPRLAFDSDRPWQETGMDSLKSLQFMLRLEAELGRSIPLDLLHPDASRRDFARHLVSQPAEVGQQARIMLIPGLLGDEPALAAFRRATADLAAYDLVEMPDIETDAAVLRDIPATAEKVADAIVARQPGGPLVIAGYSMGGIVALEAAHDLRTRGRDVALLILLDPFLRIDPKKPFRRDLSLPARPPLRIVSLARGGRVPPAVLADRIQFAALLIVGAMESARKRLFAVREQLAADTLHWRRLRLIGRLRWTALRRWKPRPWDGATLVAISDEAADHYDTAQWASLCPNAQQVAVATSHLDLFGPAAMVVLHPALASALSRSGVPA
jgi:thioesterase domain-containing protein/acyl carrier protein